MRVAPENWNSILSKSGCSVEYRLIIAEIPYEGNRIDKETFEIESSVFRSMPFIGGVESAYLKATILPIGVIPKAAEIIVEQRIRDSGLYTDWVSKGVFIIDTRESHTDGWITITAYDDMLKSNKKFIETTDEHEWPMSAPDIVAEISSRIGISLDERAIIDKNIKVPYPNEKTMRQILSDIGVALCGNFYVTEDRKLNCRLLQREDPVLELNSGEPIDFSETGDPISVKQVILKYSEDGDAYATPEVENGYSLTLKLDFATQSIANKILESLSMIEYTPFNLQHYLNPLLEVGDTISYNGKLYIIGTILWHMNEDNFCEISSASSGSIEHEYPTVGYIEGSLSNKVSLGNSYYGVSISRKNGLQIKKTDGETVSGEALFNSDVLSMRAVVDGVMKDAIYFDTATGKYKISGDVLIEGGIQSDASITDALYAEQGDISQLTVDRLETSDKIKRYLSKDKSSMSFIRIEGLKLQFIIATPSVDESGNLKTEQLESRYGSLLYWAKDISNADIVNGYPYVDDVRVYATEENTGFPIIVYSYDESVVRQIIFIYDALTGANYCTETFGQGAGTNAAGETVNQGWMQKTTKEFFIKYRTEIGKEIGIQMNNSGFTDVVGLRKPTGINFSEWDSGKFYERIDGDDTRYEYTVEFDSQGRPTKITDSTGHETAIYW